MLLAISGFFWKPSIPNQNFERTPPKLSQAKKNLIDEIQNTLVEMRKLGRPSAFELTRLWRNLLKEIPEANQFSTDFVLGGEESGHVILPATHNKELVFLGNGPLVAFKATEILYKLWLHNPEEFFKNIEALQPQGTHFTLPIYYVVKEKLLEPGFRDELCQIIQERPIIFIQNLPKTGSIFRRQ